jgi:hypothetical protein
VDRGDLLALLGWLLALVIVLLLYFANRQR